jgi:hypothetical protein
MPLKQISFNKDPNAVLDYVWDWSVWLVDDNIATATFTPGPGITVDHDTKTAKTATAWLAGGQHGQCYSVTCHIVTTAGRENDWTFIFNVRNQ